MQPHDQDPIQQIDVTLDDEPRKDTKRPRPSRHNRGGNTKKIVLILLAVIVGLAVVCGAAYWWFAVRDTGEETPVSLDQPNQQSQDTEETQPALDPQEAAKKITFKSSELALELTHRRDWLIAESDDKTAITLTSPDVSYQTVNGTVPEGRGVFTLKIQKGVPEVQSDAINALNAVKDSEVIAYDKPTDAQRFYTNISYAGLEDAFTTLIVTGSVEYKKGNPLANTLTLSGDFYLIAGGFGEDAENTLAFDHVPVSQIDSQTAKQAIDIIKSLRIQ